MSRTCFRGIYNLWLPEFHGIPCSKQAQYLNFKWGQRNLTYNPLVRKRTINHLAKLAKWLSCVVNTYLFVAFGCMLLSCHTCMSEWIYSLQFLKCQGVPSWKQAWYLKCKWNEWHSNADLSGYGFGSRCCYLNFRYRPCFEQGVPWHSGDCKV